MVAITTRVGKGSPLTFTEMDANLTNLKAATEGAQTLLSYMGVSPLTFGAVGDGNSHPASAKYASLAALQAVYPFATDLSQEMDWLGIQAALNTGGYVFSPPKSYVMCNANLLSQQPIKVIAGKSWGHFYNSQWNYPTLAAKTSNTHYNSNYNFASADGWVNATSLYTADQITSFVVANNCATFTDPAAYPSTVQSGGHFGQFGRQVTLQPGMYKLVCTVTATTGASYGSGNGNPPFAHVGFYAGPNAPFTGANLAFHNVNALNLTSVLGGNTITQTVELDFLIKTATTGWLSIQVGGYANFVLTNFDIQDWFPNCAIQMTRDGATEHYPVYQQLRGIEFIGPKTNRLTDPLDYTGVTGVRYASYTDVDGNYPVLADCVITQFDTGIEYGNGAYLITHDNLIIHENGVALHFPIGLYNAGENLRFKGGGIFNNDIGLDNEGGAEFTFVDTAVDFNFQQIVKNAGRVELHGVHMEQNLPTKGPLLQCYGAGCIQMFGGKFLGAGAKSATPPFDMRDNNSSLRFFGTEVYNAASTIGVACSGAGTVLFPAGWLNNGNPNMPLLSRAAQMDIFGSAGMGELSGAPWAVAACDPDSINIMGGVWADNTSALPLDKWTIDSHFSVARSTDYARTGTHSIAFTKSIWTGGSPDAQVMFCVPVIPAQNVVGEFYWLAPQNVGTGNSHLYTRWWWGQTIGFDNFGRPIFNQAYGFIAESDILLPLAGSPTWNKYTFSSTYQNTLTDPNALKGVTGAPPWANCFVITFDTETLPSMSWYIDDLMGNYI